MNDRISGNEPMRQRIQSILSNLDSVGEDLFALLVCGGALSSFLVPSVAYTYRPKDKARRTGAMRLSVSLLWLLKGTIGVVCVSTRSAYL
jgi:hypothetical protein